MKSRKLRKLVNTIIGFDGQKLEATIEEMKWGQKFQLLTRESKWFRGGVYPGGWAVGCPFLCILYRILDEVKPNKILELGLGQSTRLTSSYRNHEENAGKIHCVAEHDPGWIAFMENSIDLSNSQVVQLPLAEIEYKGKAVTVYENFIQKIPQEKYDLVLIDGPFGSLEYARIDSLGLVPQFLAEDFVIMIDDYERAGERNMSKDLLELLSTNGIEYHTQTYRGEKEIFVIASPSNAFVCSMF